MKKAFYVIIMTFCIVITNAQVHNGDLTLTTQTDIDNFNYTEIYGELKVSDTDPGGITNLDGLSGLTTVTGSLFIIGNADL